MQNFYRLLMGLTALAGLLSGQSSPPVAAPSGSSVYMLGADRHIDQYWWDDNAKLWSLGQISAGTFLTQPVYTTDPSAYFDLFVVGTDHQMYNLHWMIGASTWETIVLGGSFASAPMAAPGGGSVLAIGTDRHMYQFWWSSQTNSWGLYQISNNTFTSNPVYTTDGSGNFDLFAVGTDHQMYDIQWPSGSSGWQTTALGGNFISAPVATPGGWSVYGIEADQHLYQWWWDGPSGTWKLYQVSTGMFLTPPVYTTIDSSGSFDLFTVGTDHQMYDVRWSSTTSSWNTVLLGGSFLSAPIATPGGGSIVGVGADQHMYQFWWNSQTSNWKLYQISNDAFISNPAYTTDGSGNFDLLAIGADHQMYDTQWVAGTSGWQTTTLGGNFAVTSNGSPTSPTKEFIYFLGKPIAIENAY